ncbi:MAG TPA: LamG-like jellyroll fold domain-containing protein [Prolixibacteraceae bacterium]|nr:LamG-like jellyroll fold domain-containing protein [Prolixibacteraceae bacterium]
MKKHLLFTCFLSLVLVVFGLKVQAQLDYGHITHFYDFENELATDLVGGVDGEENGPVYYSEGAIDFTDNDVEGDGGYLSFVGEDIAINQYSAITIEAWATPSFDSNSGRALMMWAFGKAGGVGTNYLFFVPSRFEDEICAKMSIGDSEPWANEQGITIGNAAMGAEQLYHYVVTIDEDNMMMVYVDGENVGDIVELTGEHSLASLSNSNFVIGKSLYDADPMWRGTVDLFSIWDVALTSDEVSSLYVLGSKRTLDVVGVEDAMKADSYSFYVSNRQLFVKNQQDAKNLSVSIYNLAGSLVYANNKFVSGENLNLKEGVYLVKSSATKNSVVQSIIVR